jgi:2-hydroxycyclohexanecarboxyl-CoA dehydrogenase
MAIMRLQDKVAIVTGGARGIGVGIVRCLAADGARLALFLSCRDGENITGQAISVDSGITLRLGPS